MRQGNDVGTQYRSAIYTTSPEQAAAVEASKAAFGERLLEAGYGPITTEIAALGEFYYAEDYHQQYLSKVPERLLRPRRHRRLLPDRAERLASHSLRGHGYALHMSESIARVGEIDICYETFGDPSDPAMLLIMGLGTQMVAWHDDFCEQLAERGYFVIRHDNRDIGRSTHLDGAPVPSLLQLLRRDRRAAAYTLADMAADSVGVLDHLGIEQAHIVGASMGGMIAQTIAIRYPQRTLSLVSIMSNTGSFWSGQPALSLYALLLKPGAARTRGVHRPRGRDVHEDRRLGLSSPTSRTCATIATLVLRPRARPARLAAPARRDRRRPRPLARAAHVRVPATVIHGAEDKLVRPLRRARDGQGDPRREARRDPGHGPRPAARRVADRSSTRSSATR